MIRLRDAFNFFGTKSISSVRDPCNSQARYEHYVITNNWVALLLDIKARGKRLLQPASLDLIGMKMGKAAAGAANGKLMASLGVGLTS